MTPPRRSLTLHGASRHAIRLLVLDLDGTIVGPRLTVSRRTTTAVRHAQDAGVPVVIATGRMYPSASRIAGTLGLETPMICNQGADVRAAGAPDADDPPPLLYHRTMPSRVARDAITWARERGFAPHMNAEDRLVAQLDDDGAPNYERILGVGVELVDDLLRAVKRPTKVLAVGPADLPQRELDEARDAFAGRAQVTVSHPNYLEFTARGVHKGRAVRWLARRLGIPLRDVMAIGDQINDVEMLALVGHGVAMGGSPDPVRAAARYVTARYEEDGAALAIEALVLGRASLD